MVNTKEQKIDMNLNEIEAENDSQITPSSSQNLKTNPPSAENKTKTKERFIFIDILEIIAIFCVVFYHTGSYQDNFLIKSSFLYYLRYGLRGFMAICVPMFFFCNGFLLFSKPFNLKKHLLRMLRFAFIILFWGIVLLICSTFFGDKVTFMNFISLPFTIEFDASRILWFLRALLCVYLLFPLMKLAFDKSKTIFIYFIALCPILIFGNNCINIFFIFFKYIFYGECASWNANYLFEYNLFSGPYMVAFAYFSVGGLMCYLWPKIKTLNKTRVRIWSAVTVLVSSLMWLGMCAFIGLTRKTLIDCVWDGYVTIFTLANVLALFMFMSSFEFKNQKLNNIYTLISQNTLGIYMFHMTIKRIPFIAKMYVGSTFSFGVVYALMLCAICMGISLILKKIPIIKRLL